MDAENTICRMNKFEILQNVRKYAAENLNETPFILGKSVIPASSPLLSARDVEFLVETVLGFWYTDWRRCSWFRSELCRVLKKRKAILCNSGSSASLVAISSLAEQKKQEFIITCACGFPTTISPIYQCGKVPYYVDIDPTTLSPDFEQIEEILSSSYAEDIAGVVLAHTLGFPFNERDLVSIIPDLPLVVDCCDALGATVFESPVGMYSDIMTLSFFPAHQIFSGEGGAVLTNNDMMYRIMFSLANWGKSCTCLPGQDNVCGKRFEWEDRGNLPEGFDHKYIFDRLGYNLKMTEFQAALGLSQLLALDEFIEARRNNYSYLASTLAEIPNLLDFTSFIRVPEWSNPSPFGFPILVGEDAPFTTGELIAFLESKNVRTRRMFGGNITKQPGFMNLPYLSKDLSGADLVMNNMFWVGCHPALTIEMLDYMIGVFEEFFHGY